MSDLPVLLVAMFILAGLFEVVFPILLGWWIIRTHKTNWKLLGVGVLTFIGSQILHIPAVGGLTLAFQSGAIPSVGAAAAPYFNALVLGLLAGLFEETARWVGYKLLKKHGDSLGAAMTIGAGHGGIEAVSVGVVVLFTLVSMLSLRSLDINSLGLTAEQASATLRDMTAYFASPWHLPLAGALERIGAVILHISLSIMVWLSFSRKNALWFWGAVLYHALADGLTLLAVTLGLGTWTVEALFIAVVVVGFYLIRRAAKKAEADRVERAASQALEGTVISA
jgi:uncharacterized membrane protein YhfC